MTIKQSLLNSPIPSCSAEAVEFEIAHSSMLSNQAIDPFSGNHAHTDTSVYTW
jgi:hypothetical protein